MPEARWQCLHFAGIGQQYVDTAQLQDVLGVR